MSSHESSSTKPGAGSGTTDGRRIPLLYILGGCGLLVTHLALLLLSFEFAYGSALASRPHRALVIIEMAAGGIYLLTVLRPQTFGKRGWTLLWIVVVGLAMRGFMFPSLPVMEDDHYRYMWDGAVLAHGMNPYEFSPEEAAEGRAAGKTLPQKLHKLGLQSGKTLGRVNHPYLRTIYPPVAQLGFAPAHLVAPWSLTGWRLILLVCDLVTLGLLIKLLASLGLPLASSAIYWWNPLLVKELFNSAHMEGLLLPFLAGALLLAVKRRHMWAAACLALAAGVKFWPVLLLPFLLRDTLPKWRRGLAAIAVFAAVAALVLSPFVTAIPGQNSGFMAYGRRWEMNDALFMLFVWGLRPLQDSLGVSAQMGARVIVAFLLCAWVGWLWWKPIRNRMDLCRRCLMAIAALFLLSPTQFPWYYTWMLPLLAVSPRLSLLLLTFLLPLYYLRFYFVSLDNVGLFDNWLVWVEYIPVWILLVWEALRRRSPWLEVKQVE